MKKSLNILALALALTALSTAAAYSFTCEVSAIDGTKVTLDCKEKYAKKLTVGEKAKVSKEKERRAVEGC